MSGNLNRSHAKKIIAVTHSKVNHRSRKNIDEDQNETYKDEFNNPK
jgi:hypothetical protein